MLTTQLFAKFFYLPCWYLYNPQKQNENNWETADWLESLWILFCKGALYFHLLWSYKWKQDTLYYSNYFFFMLLIEPRKPGVKWKVDWEENSALVINEIFYTAVLDNVCTFLEYIVIFSTGKEVAEVKTWTVTAGKPKLLTLYFFCIIFLLCYYVFSLQWLSWN